MDLVTKPIKDFSHGIYDGPHATPAEATEGGIFLGIKNFTPTGLLDFSDIKYVAEEDLPRWTRRVKPSYGDVVFTYEATLHRYALIPENFHGCLGRRVALIRPDPKQLNSRYLLYYFLSESWRAFIETKVISGATVDRISIEKFPDFPISIPSLDIQNRVVDTLSAYDDLIENNKRRMALLEESARLLYQEWFVHLRFPGHEKTAIVDGVPEGWRRGAIQEFADCVGGGTPSTSAPEYWNGGDVSWLSPTDVTRNPHFVVLESEKKITKLGLQKSAAKLIPPLSILMTSRASIGYFAVMFEETSTNQGFINIIPNDSNAAMFLLFNLHSRVEEIRGLGSGSTFLEVNKAKFRAVDILFPDQEILTKFQGISLDTLRQIRLLKLQNARLREARDLLLPKLMRGEITV